MIELGIYGGTFGPIHMGHINAARSFYDTLRLDKLLVIPTYIPPHKEVGHADDPKHRLAMTELAFESDPRNITVCDYEISRGGKSYTYMTLEHFASSDVRITFLCGTDMFLTLDSWKKPERIFALSRIAHIRREDLSAEEEMKIEERSKQYRSAYGADIIDIADKPTVVSSTDIRAMINDGKDVSALVPEKVLEYIKKHRLYLE